VMVGVQYVPRSYHSNPRLEWSTGAFHAWARLKWFGSFQLSQKNLSAAHHTTVVTNKPKAKSNRIETIVIMKLFHMITTALTGVAEWDSWGSTFFQTKNQKNKTKISSLHDEIVEMLTPPPSIFVPGHTVLDPSIPFIHVNAVPSFDFSTIVSSFEDLRGVSFESIRQQVVPSAHHAMREV
jgi:hypothetical protein